MKTKEELIKIFQDYKDLRDPLLDKKRELERKVKLNQANPWTLNDYANYLDFIIFNSPQFIAVNSEIVQIENNPDYEKIVRSAYLKVFFDIDFIPR
jgi:hypothetical protein